MDNNKPKPGTYEYNKEYAKRYLQKLAYYQIRMPAGLKEGIETAARATGESVNQYILTAVQDRIDREQNQTDE